MIVPSDEQRQGQAYTRYRIFRSSTSSSRVPIAGTNVQRTSGDKPKLFSLSDADLVRGIWNAS